jgi:hypothetical protein
MLGLISVHKNFPIKKKNCSHCNIPLQLDLEHPDYQQKLM